MLPSATSSWWFFLLELARCVGTSAGFGADDAVRLRVVLADGTPAARAEVSVFEVAPDRVPGSWRMPLEYLQGSVPGVEPQVRFADRLGRLGLGRESGGLLFVHARLGELRGATLTRVFATPKPSLSAPRIELHRTREIEVAVRAGGRPTPGVLVLVGNPDLQRPWWNPWVGYLRNVTNAAGEVRFHPRVAPSPMFREGPRLEAVVACFGAVPPASTVVPFEDGPMRLRVELPRTRIANLSVAGVDWRLADKALVSWRSSDAGTWGEPPWGWEAWVGVRGAPVGGFVPGAAVSFRVQASGYEERVHRVTVPRGRSERFSLCLVGGRALARVRLRLLDASGEVVPPRTYVLSFRDRSGADVCEDSVFRLRKCDDDRKTAGVPVGMSVLLDVRVKEARVKSIEIPALASGRLLDLGDVRLQRAR